RAIQESSSLWLPLLCRQFVRHLQNPPLLQEAAHCQVHDEQKTMTGIPKEPAAAASAAAWEVTSRHFDNPDVVFHFKQPSGEFRRTVQSTCFHVQTAQQATPHELQRRIEIAQRPAIDKPAYESTGPRPESSKGRVFFLFPTANHRISVCGDSTLPHR